jgi:putative peptidoglycan lipid II flippase
MAKNSTKKKRQKNTSQKVNSKEKALIKAASTSTIAPVEEATLPVEKTSDVEAPIEEVIPQIEDATASQAGIIEKAPGMIVETETPPKSGRGHIVKSAALVSIGNLGSSLLGMVRQVVVTSLGSGIAGSFNAAITPINTFYQLLVNGSTDGALIPVFNEYAAPEKRQEMRRIVFTVVNLILIISLISSIVYVLFSPWLINVLVSKFTPSDRALTLLFSQIIFFSLVVLGPFAVLLAALFSLKEFGWPAFATASYHAGIIVGAIVFYFIGSHYIGQLALPLGLLIGATGQIVLLLPGIRKQRLYYMFVLDLKHPALRRIIKLYWPIAISYVFSMFMVYLDLYLQGTTRDREAAVAAMAAATTLIQFPVGLVAQALSVAVLPTLSQQAREGNSEGFKTTLLLGFRLGLLLMIPAMTGLLILRSPIIYLIFMHHKYSLANANLTALALQNYAYQLPFVALDQLLIAAFYARKNTKKPVITGIVCYLFYLAVALPFYKTIGVAALAFANTVQISAQAIILLILLRMAIGPLNIRATIPTILKICFAALLMGVAAWAIQLGLANVALFSLKSIVGQFLTLIIAGGIAVVIYFGTILLFKVEEITMLRGIVRAKLVRK